MNTDLSWKKVKEEKYRAGYRKLIKKYFVLPSGVEMDYDLLDDGNDLAILALNPENNVVLVKVFRLGPEMVLTEMPAGMLKPDDDIYKKAEAELLEETGYKGEIEFVGKVVHDAYSSKIRHVFVAKNCIKVAEPTTNEEDEKYVEIITMDINDFRNHLRSGQLTDVESGYLCLDHLNLL